MILLVAAFVAANAADLVLTIVALRMTGGVGEVNPLMNRVYALYGEPGLLAAKVVLGAVLLWLLWAVPTRGMRLVFALGTVAIGLAALSALVVVVR